MAVEEGGTHDSKRALGHVAQFDNRPSVPLVRAEVHGKAGTAHAQNDNRYRTLNVFVEEVPYIDLNNIIVAANECNELKGFLHASFQDAKTPQHYHQLEISNVSVVVTATIH